MDRAGVRLPRGGPDAVERRQREAVHRPPGGFVAFLVLGALAGPLLTAFDARSEPDGAALFATVGCTGCHGMAGEGRRTAPVLAGIPRAPRTVAVQMIDGGGMMPSFARLTDADIAAVANYVANILGGRAGSIDAATVATLRP